jgi:hypothetical protein
MSLSLSPSLRAGLPRVPRLSAPAVRGTTLVSVVVVSGILTAAASTVLAQSGTSSLSTVGALVVAALVVVALPYLLTRDRRRRRARTKETVAWIERLHLCGSPSRAADLTTSVHRAVTDPTSSPQVRSLQLHVRTLETALEEQSTRLMQARRDIDERRAADLERVLVTIGSLRGRLGGELDGNRVLDRVEAAVLRLSQGTTPARPALPVHWAGSRPATAEPTDAGDIAPQTSSATAAPAETPSGERPFAVPAPAQSVEEVVLPVPAPQCDFAPSRRRRLRRSVA